MNEIIAIDTNTAYMQFIVDLNNAVQKNRNTFLKGGSLEVMIADVLGPLYQVKSLQRAKFLELECLTNSLFKDVQDQKISSFDYNLKMQAITFVENTNADLLLNLSKERYKDMLDILNETNFELFSKLPDYVTFLEQLFGQKSFQLVHIQVQTIDDKTIPLFG